MKAVKYKLKYYDPSREHIYDSYGKDRACFISLNTMDFTLTNVIIDIILKFKVVTNHINYEIVQRYNT